MRGETVRWTDARGCQPTLFVELADQLFERISFYNSNINNIGTGGSPTLNRYRAEDDNEGGRYRAEDDNTFSYPPIQSVILDFIQDPVSHSRL